jgi:hypothetical protein
MKEIAKPNDLTNFNKVLWLILFFSTSILVASLISKYFSRPMNVGLICKVARMKSLSDFSRGGFVASNPLTPGYFAAKNAAK